jgi:hypothetical protein
MNISKRLCLIASIVTLSACGAEQPVADPVVANDVLEANTPTERFTAASIEKARALIKAEPKVIDFIYEPLNAVEWAVAVKDDGTRRHGYAGYICMLLRDAGAYDDEVEVRIVDAAKIAEFKDAYRSYSLGTVRCQSGEHFD